MPSIEAPTHYDRAKGIAAGYADDFLKSLDPNDAAADTGNIESSLGFVMLVEVTRDMIAEYVSVQGDPWMSEARNFWPGWYIIRHDDNGLVWGMDYGGNGTHSEELARADFAEAEAVDAIWHGQTDNIPSNEEG